MERQPLDSSDLQYTLRKKEAELTKADEACSVLRHECNAIRDTINILDQRPKG